MSGPNQSQPLGQSSRLAMPTPRAPTESDTSHEAGQGQGSAGGTPRSSLDHDPRVGPNGRGVLTSPGPPNGTTTMYEPGPVPAPGQGYAEGFRRQSGDYTRIGGADGAGRTGGHRSATHSTNQSPTSEASSSRHIIHGGEPRMLGEPRIGGGGGTGAGGGPHENPMSKLPRITTTSAGEPSGDEGPRSAPIIGPLRPPVLAANGPMRSSSSPEPWNTAASNASTGGGTSPVDSRPPPPLLGNPFYPAPSLQFPTPQLPAPPRRSSHQNRQSSAQPHLASSQLHSPALSQHSQQSASAFIGGSGGASGQDRDRQERSLGSQSSHHSLSGSNANTADAGSHAASNSSPNPGDVPREKEVRVGRSRDPTYCGQCSQLVHGQFVRAMGKVYHLNCFRCKDCNKVVAQKFFPVEDGEGMYPLCERDYFARLDLICGKCNQALRSSYITACGEKYHVEHFTCSECDVVFGPNDSYYEHSGKVYCHFHYSTRFAVKCVGCETAILKQFVEMNRNGKDECWHPECYMISKFWNVRLASKNFNTPANSAVSSSVSLLEMTPAMSQIPPQGLTSIAGNITGTSTAMSPVGTETLGPVELKAKQESMEMKVLQIWHVLSGYEESSAALIGEMLRAVNGRNLLEIVLLAERFILHVEALFAVIDDLEAQFSLAGVKGMSHAREAKQLCRKLVNLFSTMSQISPNAPSQPNNQDLYTLITQLAHYLKILIRIALTGSIKLEREQGHSTAMFNALGRLNLLAMDASDPTLAKRGDYPELTPGNTLELPREEGTATPASGSGADEEQLKRAIDALPRRPLGFIASTQNIAYGYRSLAPEATHETTLRGPQEEDFVPPEGCAHCHQAIEEDCIRLGMFDRWHSPCVQCAVCGDRAVPLQIEDPEDQNLKYREDGTVHVAPKPKRPPPRTSDFVCELPLPPSTIYCLQHQTHTAQGGFESVSRLEQYAFLLHIALRRLYVHFRLHHNLPSVRDHGLEDIVPAPGFDVKRMKSVVTLDRKLSSTARLPQRSTVVESPAGRLVNSDGRIVSARSRDITPPKIVTEDEAFDAEPPGSATVDVIRPAFARNNTNVMIVNDNNPDLPPEIVEQLQTHQLMQEDDAITLGDIPLLADQTRRSGQHEDAPPLLASLNQLQSLILKHFALLSLQKSGLGHLIELDEVLELLDMRKNQWWNKIFKGNVKDKQKKKGVFGVPLEVLIERTGSDSQQGASNEQLRVPEFIEEMIATMRQMDMAVEGIFRKNGNIRRLQQISEALDKDSTAVNLSEENPVQLAALLKRFLRELPDPLLTFKLHKLFCAAASFPQPEERSRCMHLLICLLPRYNRDTMEVLFVFLKWVASFSYKDEETGSRMDLGNLATVICPSILYAKGANAARDESFIGITAIQDMLENQDEYYTVPSELRFVIAENIFSIFAKDLDLPPKEIHRHCSKYMQARGQPVPPPSGPAMAAGGAAGGGRGGGGQRIPGSNSGQIRERPSDSRMSVHRSEGNLAGDGQNSTAGPIPVPSPYRPSPSQAVGIPGSSQAAGGAGGSGVGVYSHLSSSNSRPASFLQSQSQQSLHSVAAGLGGASERGPGHGWRVPFHHAAGNSSRNSSRGSAPNSPGPESARGSMQIEREGRRTPVPMDHR